MKKQKVGEIWLVEFEEDGKLMQGLIHQLTQDVCFCLDMAVVKQKCSTIGYYREISHVDSDSSCVGYIYPFPSILAKK